MPICDIYLWLRTDRRTGWCLKVPLNRHICNLLKHPLTTSAVCNVFSAASIGGACENSLRWINRGMFWQAIWQLKPAEISGRNSPHKLSRRRLDLLSSYQPLHLGVVDHYVLSVIVTRIAVLNLSLCRGIGRQRAEYDTRQAARQGVNL